MFVLLPRHSQRESASALPEEPAKRSSNNGWIRGFPSTPAQLAYALSIPPLTGADSIGDFIACVTHGMLPGAIPGSDATRLLYAAQIAHSAVPRGRKSIMKILEKAEKKETGKISCINNIHRQNLEKPYPPPSPAS